MQIKHSYSWRGIGHTLNGSSSLPVSVPPPFFFFKVRELFFGSPNWEVHFVIHLMEKDGVSLSVFFELMVKFLSIVIK